MKLFFIGNIKDLKLQYYEGLPRELRQGPSVLAYHVDRLGQEDNPNLINNTSRVVYLVGETTATEEAAYLKYISSKFPGKEITLLTAVKVGETPPGEYLEKSVSVDGVLPL